MAQSRIACLRIPKFQIAVHQKNDPALKGKPFVLITGKGARAQVMMCSAEAAHRQVAAGMKLSEAKAACAELIWREYDATLYADAQKALSSRLIACSPKVSYLEPGLLLLDASGLQYLGGEDKFCRQIHRITGKSGYVDVHIGIADSAFAATIASKFKRRQYFLVPEGNDAQFLAPLSIEHLPINADMQEALHQLGIRTMGQLVHLSAASLTERFAADGLVAFQLAQGIDNRQPHLPPMEKEFKASVDLGAPIELLHEIQFVLKSMIDRLAKQLRLEGWWAEELVISFYNDDDRFDERTIKLLKASNHPKFLLEVMKLSLEASPIQREVTGIALSVSRFTKEAWQQEAIDKVSVDSAEHNNVSEIGTPLSLTLMLQRFLSRLGEHAVVKSIPNDHYAPEHAGAWLPVTGKTPVSPVVAVNVSYINTRVGPAGLAAGFTLRKCQPPCPVLVEFQSERPTALTYNGAWYRVREITEPERLSGLWWENPVRKSYYVALLEPREPRQDYNSNTVVTEKGLLVMLTHDHEENAWQITGFYD